VSIVNVLHVLSTVTSVYLAQILTYTVLLNLSVKPNVMMDSIITVVVVYSAQLLVSSAHPLPIALCVNNHTAFIL